MASGVFNGLTPAVSTNGKNYYKMSWTVDGRGPATESIWPGPILKSAQELRQGDRISVNKVQKGNYWNVQSIVREAGNAGSYQGGYSAPSESVAQAAPRVDAAPVQPRPQSYDYARPKSPEEQHAIARAVALDKAVTFVGSLIASEKYKKTVTPDLLWREVEKYTQMMFEYLIGKRQIVELSTDVSSVSTDDPDFDQTGTFTE